MGNYNERMRAIGKETSMKCLLLALVVLAASCAASPQQSPAPASQAAADEAEAVAGSNAFAGDLYAHLRTRPGNLFFSPESISTALAMAYAGARGQTASEMARVFHYTLPPDQLNPAMGAMLKDMNAPHPGFELHVADALWAQKDVSFLDSYLTVVQSAYGAGFHPVDFKSSPNAVRATINQWVAQQTSDKIKDLLPPGTVTPATRLVLTNAIYFKGNWVQQFNPRETKSDPFHLSPSQSIQAPFMHRTGAYRYFDGASFQMVELPYKGEGLSMLVILPRKIDGIQELESSFTAAAAGTWIEKLQRANKVNLALPRFTITQQFELSGTLGAMGMPQAFSNAADFSGMTGKRDFSISAAVHKAFVDVNETGTEAAAATGIAMMAMAARPSAPLIPFIADHPFLFMIRDTKSGSILFLGRLADPTK
jgi:serpin B